MNRKMGQPQKPPVLWQNTIKLRDKIVARALKAYLKAHGNETMVSLLEGLILAGLKVKGVLK